MDNLTKAFYTGMAGFFLLIAGWQLHTVAGLTVRVAILETKLEHLKGK